MNFHVGNYTFEERVLLNTWNPPSHGGIYVIFAVDASNNSNILYIGQTKDFSDRIDSGHHKYQCWLNHVQNKTLCISTRRVDGEDERKNIESHLIKECSPICNDD